MRARKRVLVVTPFEHIEWRWLAPYFPEDRFEWSFMNGQLFGHKKPAWLRYAWRAAGRARDFDVVVSHSPYMTLWTALALRARGVAKPHLAFSFNHGNKRFFGGVELALARRVLGDVALFNVLSAGERDLFHERYGIPLDRLRFSHWAVQPPVVRGVLPDEVAARQPYVCAIGRNNRDFETFLRATDGLPVNAVVVCTKAHLPSMPQRPNLLVKADIGLDESMAILAGSLFSVVPILDNSTGAGHMTFVHAMHLGKAQVTTDVENSRDYLFDGVHGLRVPPRDAAAMRGAIQRLLDNPAEREEFERNAREFAERWLSEPAAARTAREVLEAWADGRTLELEPSGWAEYKREAKAGSRV